jgi:hypothetical protein
MQHLRDLLDREIETLAIQTNTVISANTAAASEWAFRFQTFGEAKLSEILLFGSEVGLGVPGVKQRKAVRLRLLNSNRPNAKLVISAGCCRTPTVEISFRNLI